MPCGNPIAALAGELAIAHLLGQPQRAGVAITDLFTGLYSVSGILAALLGGCASAPLKTPSSLPHYELQVATEDGWELSLFRLEQQPGPAARLRILIQITDEEERMQIYDMIVGFGTKAVPTILRAFAPGCPFRIPPADFRLAWGTGQALCHGVERGH